MANALPYVKPHYTADPRSQPTTKLGADERFDVRASALIITTPFRVALSPADSSPDSRSIWFAHCCADFYSHDFCSHIHTDDRANAGAKHGPYRRDNS